MPKVPPRLDPDDPVQGLALDMRTLRLRAGSPSLAELARRMSCSHSTVSAYLNGHRLAPPDQLRAFALACRADPSSWLAKLEDIHRLLSRLPARNGAEPSGPADEDAAPGGTSRPEHMPGEEPAVVTIRPREMTDVRDLWTSLRGKSPLIIDLASATGDDVRRISDYAAGLAAGAEGSIKRVAGRVLALLPPGVPARLRVQAINDAYRLGTGLSVTPLPRPPDDSPKVSGPRPPGRIVGVGGAGINVVDQAAELGDVQVIAVDTDALGLMTSSAGVQVELSGPHSAGPWHVVPATAAQAAEAARDKLAEAFAGAELVFVVVGEGGGTGAGAAPVIASVARSAGAFTIGVTSTPFSFEGPHKTAVAADGITRLRGEVDTLLVIPNDRLPESGSIAELFRLADAALINGLRCILDPINRPGIINLGLADIKHVLSGGGLALIGTGSARGSDRAVAAAGIAISSMLAQAHFQEARTMLMSVRGGPELTLNDINEAVNIAYEWGGVDVDLTFGASVDDDMVGVMQVTIIAAGIV